MTTTRNNQVTSITNVEFGKMIHAAAALLAANAEKINKLNVFPVPDGDTGTNMSLSMASGAQYVQEELSTSVGQLAKASAKGLLMGARGNSGVILSQIIRGFAKSIEDKTTLNATDVAEALKFGATTAYQSVMKPTEGTILTVIRLAASAADDTAKNTDDIVLVLEAAYEAAKLALADTPNLLPVLKEVGVVDSGGQGLVFVLQAFYQVLAGQFNEDDIKMPDDTQLDAMVEDLHAGAQADLDPADIKYGYCTEMMVEIGKGTTFDHDFDYETFYNHLATMGDSLLVINDDEVVKVHVHTEDPGAVFSWGTHFGSLAKTKVDNMRDQQQAVIDAQAKQIEQLPGYANKTAIIAISAGAGLTKVLKSLGVTHVIEGGQTMNPSTADIVTKIKDSGAKEVILLPNNSNIFMAAEQAQSLSDIPVAIVKTRSIQQALSAMMGFNPNHELMDNQAAMNDLLADVKSGEVTQAVRDTQMNGEAIKNGDYIGLLDGEITVVNKNRLQAAQNLLQAMIDDETELVTILTGKEAKESETKKLATFVASIDEDIEVEIQDGGQPLYPYLFAVE